MSVVHIFGVNHFLQNPNPECMTPSGREVEAEQKAVFREVLVELINVNGVELIAEEAKDGTNCLGLSIAQELGIAFIDITMPIAERQKRGIKTPDYDRSEETRRQAYRVFEGFMFVETKGKGAAVTLVVCGRRHLDRLAKLFRAAGDEVHAYDIYDCTWWRGIPIEAAEGVVGYARRDADGFP